MAASNTVRAHEAVVAEAAFSVFRVTGERLLDDWIHWGRFVPSVWSRVLVGLFDESGMNVSRKNPDCTEDWLGVVRTLNPAVCSLVSGA